MKLNRIFFPALLALALLFTQHGGTVHVLTHALPDQPLQNKHLPLSSACEQCAVYAQLGSALNSTASTMRIVPLPTEAMHYEVIAFHSTLPPTAIARGPPVQLQNIA